MMASDEALRDPGRLGALARAGLLAGRPDPAFDRLTELAGLVLRVPVALVSIVDVDRQVFIGCLGLPEPWASRRETPLSHSFCQHVVERRTPFVVEDAREHPLVRDNPAIEELGVVAYAGMPLITSGGAVLGSFCVIDARPRRWSGEELGILVRLAESAVTEIELRTAERTAAENALLLSTAMDAADLAAWSYDVAADRRWNSARASDILGLGAEETSVSRAEWLARVHADDRDRVSTALDGILAADDRYTVEYRVVGDDGAERWVATMGRVLRGPDGRPERIVGTIQDISQRLRRDAERREGAERLRTLLEAVPLFAWLNGADGSAEYYNRRWYRYTGQSEREVLEGRWMEAIHPADRARARAARERGIATGDAYAVEFRVRSADGVYRWVAARVEPVRGSDGAPTAWVGAALDIEERRELEDALRASETRFRTLQDVSPDGSALFTPVRNARGEVTDFSVTYVNAAATRILTGGDEALVGRTIREAFPESVAAGRLDAYRRVLETGEPWQEDVTYSRGDVRRGLRVIASKVGDGVHVDFADLTARISAAAERERLFAATAEARARLSAILGSISAAFLAVGDDWRITYMNEPAGRYFTARGDALLGEVLWDALPPGSSGEHRDRLSQVMRERVTEQYDIYSAVSGRWLHLRADPAPDGGLSVFIEDIDERRRAEAWRDGQRRVLEQIATAQPLDAVLHSVSALAESQLHGRIVAVLLRDEREARLRSAAAPSLSPEFMRAVDGLPIGPDVGTCGTAAHAAALVVTEDIATDPRWTTLRGAAAREGLRSCWSRPIVAADGRVLGTFAIYGRTPASPSELERRILEDAAHLAGIALERARSETEREALLVAERAARAEAETARATADAANRAKSDFLAMMSHELRTPLNAIGGYAELIEMGVRGPTTPEQRADLARLQKSQRHLLGLINGVLNYAKVDAGAVHYDVSDVPVPEVVVTCEALTAPQVRAKGLVLTHSGCDRALVARADREKLQQIVLNLLSNAVKFTDPGGRITLACASADDGASVRIEVTDTGQGIPAEKIGRIFEPFVQVDTRLTRTQEGTGLGLAISRDLARGMGGDLTARSEPGDGSTFRLTLPAAGAGSGSTPA